MQFYTNAFIESIEASKHDIESMNIVISLLSTEEFSKERAYQTVFNGTRRRFEIPDAPQCVILDMIPEVLQILSENQRKRIFIHR